MNKQMYVSVAWLDNVLPSLRELAARMLCMISIPVALSQTVFWWMGISAKPGFTAKVSLIAWAGVVGGGIAWRMLYKRRTAILNRNPPMDKKSS